MLARDPEAAALHDAGLAAEIQGDYTEASRNLGAAALVLAQLPSNVEVAVQHGRVLRDLAMTYLRQGIADMHRGLEPDALFAEAKRLSDVSVAKSGSNSIWLNQDWFAARPAADHAEVCAEHGASLSVSARIETALRAAGHSDDPTNLSMLYDFAGQYLWYGKHAYYSASHAAVAARYERSTGNALDTAVWGVRMVSSAFWSVRHDPTNRAAAFRTVFKRMPHLRSQRAAQQSILARP